MELLLIAAVIALLRWVAGKMSAEEEAPAPLPPPVPAPRPRRFRRPAPAPAEMPEEVAPSRLPSTPPPPVPAAFAPPRPPSRQLSAHARDFRDLAALRRAVVAREVLGPPVCLRR